MEYALGTSTNPTTTVGWTSDISEIKAINTGTYYVWYRVPQTTNYNAFAQTLVKDPYAKITTDQKASVTTPPSVDNSLVYNKTAQQLIIGGGVASHGTMYFAVGTDENTRPTNFTTNLAYGSFTNV